MGSNEKAEKPFWGSSSFVVNQGKPKKINPKKFKNNPNYNQYQK